MVTLPIEHTARSRSAALITNKVIRNVYVLLFLTLLFNALTGHVCHL